MRNLRHSSFMEPVTAELRRLRMSANPPLSVRGMAEALGVPLSSYSRYENNRYFKKPFLPMEFVRRIAPILVRHGVDAFEVMSLAGLKGDEAKPDVDEIKQTQSAIQFVQMAVAMPSANALTQMFDALLLGFREDAPRAELAEGLARRLPIALAQLQGPLFEINEDEEHVPASVAPPRATGRRAPPSQPRS